MKEEPVSSARNLDSKLQILVDSLNAGQGGFIGLIMREFVDNTPDVLSKQAIEANKGRQLYPQLQYLCNYLNSGKRLF